MTAEAAQPSLSPRRRALVAIGLAMFAAHIVAAALVAPAATGDDPNPALLVELWGSSLLLSVATVLLLVRQADRPDLATAAFLVTIGAFSAFALRAGFDSGNRGNELVDSLFFGVTAGAMTALPVWGAATLVARLLGLPTSERISEEG